MHDACTAGHLRGFRFPDSDELGSTVQVYRGIEKTVAGGGVW